MRRIAYVSRRMAAMILALGALWLARPALAGHYLLAKGPGSGLLTLEPRGGKRVERRLKAAEVDTGPTLFQGRAEYYFTQRLRYRWKPASGRTLAEDPPGALQLTFTCLATLEMQPTPAAKRLPGSAQAAASINKDGVQAHLTITPPKDGRPGTRDEYGTGVAALWIEFTLNRPQGEITANFAGALDTGASPAIAGRFAWRPMWLMEQIDLTSAALPEPIKPAELNSRSLADTRTKAAQAIGTTNDLLARLSTLTPGALRPTTYGVTPMAMALPKGAPLSGTLAAWAALFDAHWYQAGTPDLWLAPSPREVEYSNRWALDAEAADARNTETRLIGRPWPR